VSDSVSKCAKGTRREREKNEEGGREGKKEGESDEEIHAEVEIADSASIKATRLFLTKYQKQHQSIEGQTERERERGKKGKQEREKRSDSFGERKKEEVAGWGKRVCVRQTASGREGMHAFA